VILSYIPVTMSDPAPARMTSDEFIAWAMEQPEGRRYELLAGTVVAMAPERSAHALTKANIWRRLTEAVERDGLSCTVYPDGMAVEIDATTVYEPDALVRCGTVVPPDAVKLTDPAIVVEILSPSTRARDHGDKLIDYFRLPSVHHYLIVRTEDQAIIHHARNADGTILTRIVREGTLHFDPPGLTVTGLFPATH
jgi:Uma2 family endonuclease